MQRKKNSTNICPRNEMLVHINYHSMNNLIRISNFLIHILHLRRFTFVPNLFTFKRFLTG